MPYSSIAELPKGVKSLPVSAQRTWLRVFDRALSGTCDGDETCAFKIAWSVVKKSYKKEDGTWKKLIKQIHVTDPTFEIESDGLVARFNGAAVLLDSNLTVSEDQASQASDSNLFFTKRVSTTGAGYVILAGGRKVVYLPQVTDVPSWVDGADLVFAPAEVAKNLPNGVSLDQVGSIYVAKEVQDDNTPPSFAITKSIEESRYTLGPMYVPDFIDAHNDWTDATELEKAVWNYVRKGDRTIHLQHSDQVAGEWVSIMPWPYEHATTLNVPGGAPKTVKFPPGTVYMGVIWEPFAWNLVKSGRLKGFSMSGRGKRTITVDFAGLQR